jgi:hypothetical protein
VKSALAIGVFEVLALPGTQASGPVTGRVLFDTGATKTVVDEAAIKQLGIQPAGVTNVSTPSGTAQQLLYPAELEFLPMHSRVKFTFVIGSPHLAAQGLLALIGRDVMRHMVLIYNGFVGQWVIAQG